MTGPRQDLLTYHIPWSLADHTKTYNYVGMIHVVIIHPLTGQPFNFLRPEYIPVCICELLYYLCSLWFFIGSVLFFKLFYASTTLQDLHLLYACNI